MHEEQSKSRHFDMLHTAFGAVINSLLNDPAIIEIMLNPDGKLWAEAIGKGKFFTKINLTAKEAANIIKLVAAFRHTIVDSDHPEISCELPESGARFQGWLPPVSSEPTFSIRKRARQIFSLTDYVKNKCVTLKEAEWLSKAIKERKNILISGGTASGKTTFANALLNELVNSEERIFILEDLPELQILSEDNVKLRTSPGKTMRDLVKGILRMRPDRIIIGEVRDGAALELLKAWNTGHPGGISTIHANSPAATLSRLEDLIQEVVSIVPKRLIPEAINAIVFMQRDNEGRYKITSIHEYVAKNDNYELRLLS